VHTADPADLLQRVRGLPALALELAVEVRYHGGDWRVPGDDRCGLLRDSCGALALCVGAHQRVAAVLVLPLVPMQSGDQPVHQIRGGMTAVVGLMPVEEVGLVL
jgi:hypothetical protein